MIKYGQKENYCLSSECLRGGGNQFIGGGILGGDIYPRVRS